MIETITFPAMRTRHLDMLSSLHRLAETFAKEGGSLKQIWVSREIYDLLTIEAMEQGLVSEPPSSDPKKDRWMNGLIVLNTNFGKVKVRLDDE